MNELEINIINAVLIFAAAIVPIYLCLRLDGYLKLLTCVLSGFVTIHGIYHLLEILHYEELAEGLFEPLSIVLLIVFGVMYMRIRKKKEVVVS